MHAVYPVESIEFRTHTSSRRGRRNLLRGMISNEMYLRKKKKKRVFASQDECEEFNGEWDGRMEVTPNRPVHPNQCPRRYCP